MWKRIVPGVLLVWFLLQTVQALADHSYVGFFLIGNANSATSLLMLDLVLALGLLLIWLVRDARQRQGSYLPHVAITLLFGVAGPLLYFVTRGWGRSRERVVALGLLALLSVAAVTFWSYADLRTPTAREASAETARLGRELLHDAAERHGLEAWQRHTTLETVATDEFLEGGWWPVPEQRFRSQALLGTFTSRVELLGGPADGEVRGLQSWKPYRQAPGASEPAFLDAPAPEITFYLPTLQYFAELPFRVLSAETVHYAGPATHRGRLYERVLVTWGSPEPHAEHDQYLVWIGSESGLIEMVRYTVRDLDSLTTGFTRKLARPLGVGTIHFDDYRNVDGVMIPFVQTVVLPEPALTQHPVADNFYHRLVIEEARFDTVPPELLQPAPGLTQPGDSKPLPAA